MKKSVVTLVALLSLSLGVLSGCSGSGKIKDLSYDEWQKEEGVICPAIPELQKKKKKDFIFGMDISSIIEVENAMGVPEGKATFFDFDGNPVDIFEFLADCGVNYVRIRLWNNPYDEEGNSFGGGGNDLETDIKIAQRAVAAGMKVCLDFHYSDFWADPDKQTGPLEWSGSSTTEARNHVKEYTYDVLMAFYEAGCLPSMVQCGNEVNNGIMVTSPGRYNSVGLSGGSSWCMMDGIATVRQVEKEVGEEILTVAHFAQGATYASISGGVDTLIENGCDDFDIIGLSYYSYWHGSMDNFNDCLERLEKNYPQYDVCVMEYSYGYTDDYSGNSSNIYSTAMEEAGGYKTSVQGQTSYIHDVNAAVAGISTGIGTFYWEPAWMPVEGTSWASSAAGPYLEAQGQDSSGLDVVTWANQALFGYDYHPLDSLKAFRLMKGEYSYKETQFTYDTTIEANVDISVDDIAGALPSDVKVLTELDRWINAPITWDKDDVARIKSGGSGFYTISGTAELDGETFEVIGDITAYKDYLKNGGFEDTDSITDLTDSDQVANWDISVISGTSTWRVENKNPHSGGHNYNVWSAGAFENELTQDIYGVEPGDYFFQCYARSAGATGSGDYPDCTLFARGLENQVTVASTAVLWGKDYSTWELTTLYFTVTETCDLQVGVHSKGTAECWAHFDDFALGEVVVDDTSNV